ncbi:MAG: FAD-binding oxidoreductase [Candidatus Lokiarchaeota archaeon]|nr:FAD-binding oxidoreductase [Candidatus Lokiarchaeota archaeon]
MCYKTISSELKQELRKIVGDQYYFDEIEIRWAYASGTSVFNKDWMPELVLIPQNTNQISLILQMANDHCIPITPRGSGTNLSAETMTPFKGIVLDLSQMNKITSLSLEDNIVVVEPGVVCDDLNAILKNKGYFFPPDPGSSAVATIGGLVANNAGGVQAYKYGVTKNYVLFLEVVLTNGDVVTFGSQTLKSVSSYNILDLFVGSEGTLGVITRIGLRIRPLPKYRKLGLFLFKTPENVAKTVIKLRKKAILPNLLEFLDEFVVNAINIHLGRDLGEIPSGHALIAEMDGNSKHAVEEDFQSLLAIILEQEPIYYKIAESEEERERIVKIRKSSLPALSRISPSCCVEDCSIKITDFVSVVKSIWAIPSNINAKYLKVCVAGHMEGNLHPRFLFNENDEKQLNEFEKAIEFLYTKIILPKGGSLTGEHGIGKIKTPFLEIEHGTEIIQLMNRIKKLFDPKRILNPGSGKGSKSKLLLSRSPRKLKFLKNSVLELNCMRCGLCTSKCPSRIIKKTEAHSPRGRLSILNGLVHGELVLSELIAEILHECMLCGLCVINCPAGVDTIQIFEKAREIIHKKI